MRFDDRKIRLNLLKGRQTGYDLDYFFRRSRAVFCDGLGVILVHGFSAGYVDVDESAQAIVLAKIAARVFVARCPIANVRDSFEANKRGLASVAPEAVRLLGCSDCAGFAAVFVHYDLRLFAIGSETGLDEINLGFDHGQVVLCAALEDEAAAERGQIRNTGYVEEDVLREHIGETCQNLFGPPALALEVDDVGLHEDRASIAKGRHGFGGEGDVGKLFHLHAKALCCRLQEVAVAGGTLRVQLEVFYATVFQDNELNVLAPDIDDDMGIVVELQR